MKNRILFRILIMLAIYFGLRYFGGDIGRKLMYPIQLLVTFLHEFGHALGALISGGSVDRIQINQDGSGYTGTIGGSRSIILMGGYIGSAIFGNILFFIGARAKPLVTPMLIILALVMLFTGVFWYNSAFTSGILFLFAALLLFIALKTSIGREIMMFLGLSTIIYIIQDFNVGPSSDLEKYAEHMNFIPANIWMYIWLVIVVSLFLINLRILIRFTNNQIKVNDDDEDFLTI